MENLVVKQVDLDNIFRIINYLRYVAAKQIMTDIFEYNLVIEPGEGMWVEWIVGDKTLDIPVVTRDYEFDIDDMKLRVQRFIISLP